MALFAPLVMPMLGTEHIWRKRSVKVTSIIMNGCASTSEAGQQFNIPVFL